MSNTGTERKLHGTKHNSNKGSHQHGMKDVTGALKVFAEAVYVLLPARVATCTAESAETTSPPLSGSVRSHRAAEDTALPFHFHLCWSLMRHGRELAGSSNGFSA